MTEAKTATEQALESTVRQADVSCPQVEELANARAAELRSRLDVSSRELQLVAEELAEMASYLGKVARSHNMFLSNVSHELRTPLTVAKGWISIATLNHL